MNNIRSLFDSSDKKGNKEVKKETESFAGGEKSGIAIANPSDDSDSPWSRIPQMRGPVPQDAVKVTVYKNGFQINDGEFRNLESPENVKFMKELQSGYAPQELRSGIEKGNVHIVLDDRKTEEFEVPPPPKYTLFSGQGQALRYVLTSAITQEHILTNIFSSGNSASQSASKNVVDIYKAKVNVNENAPTTTIAFRLHDGQRISQRFNLTHTVRDVHAFVSRVAPVSGSYQLVSGFPPTPISTNQSMNIEAAGLVNAVIQQRV